MEFVQQLNITFDSIVEMAGGPRPQHRHSLTIFFPSPIENENNFSNLTSPAFIDWIAMRKQKQEKRKEKREHKEAKKEIAKSIGLATVTIIFCILFLMTFN